MLSPSFNFSSLPSRDAYEFQPLTPRLHESDLHNLFAFVWARDSYNFEHPRYRIQIALSILLIVYAGLNPKAALKEGLYYRDTKLLFTQQNDELRFLLLICLNDHKNVSSSARRWGGYVTYPRL
jgi:hypothetical protein